MASSPTGGQDRKIILLVTDDPERHTLVEAMLRKRISDATVFWASDGISALAKAENAPPHIIIMDFEMARIPGPKFIEAIVKQEQKGVSTAFVVIGALPEKEALLDELVTGKVQFLTDPKEESELIQCVMKALNFAFHGKTTHYSLRLLAQGDQLIKEGDKAATVFIVKKGQLRAVKRTAQGEVELGKIAAGEFIGEMAYINGEPRSADVEALTDCELIEISVGTLDRILFSRPAWCKSLMRTLTKRLKEANQKRAGEG